VTADPDRLLRTLPPHLAERCRWVAPRHLGASLSSSSSPSARRVIWWVHHALREHENPALDTAAAIAMELQLPLLPVAVIGGGHPFDNDRHLTFVLEGLRDLQAALRGRGLDLLVLDRTGVPGESPLRTLAREAAAVVTEDLPAEPWPRWLAAFAEAIPTPLLAVDTACVVPMNLSARRRPWERAFAFRDAFAAERAARVGRAWPESPERPAVERLAAAALPAPALDLATLEIAAIVGEHPIDHGVGPVVDTVGGSAAGYARWEAFKQQGLARYARDRNDAAIDGVSRLSAYLHYGMVSPLRIAREAHAAGAEKYLDELLVWRELAYHWCRQVPGHGTLAALPAWAQRTLEGQREEPRRVLDLETLARGVVGDEVWDLAQRSLLRHGELHNNLRMTWGKAIPAWSATPKEALQRLIDLNHRYALDGCDPSSYGGLLWCLGLFDRPFETQGGVLGSIRGRSTAEHARRLDLARYRRRVERPVRVAADRQVLRVAVIGAGVAGLVAARTLVDHGIEVTLFEKGRGPGGRISTRRSAAGRFDHGAATFTAHTALFRRSVEAWVAQGVVAAWPPRVARLAEGAIRTIEAPSSFTGVGGMNRLARHLAGATDGPEGGGSGAAPRAVLHAGVRIVRCVRDGSDGDCAHRWRLAAESGDGSAAGVEHGPFDALLITAPPVQSAALLRSIDRAPQLEAEVGRVADLIERLPTAPRWVAMATLVDPIALPWPRVEIADGGPLAAISDQGAKPGRDETPGRCWVLEASAAWSRAHLEDPAEEVASKLVEAFGAVLSEALRGAVGALRIESAVAHRWRYALGAASAPQRGHAHWIGDASIGIGGDWSAGGPGIDGVEAAFLAGIALAGNVLRRCRPAEAWRDPEDTPLPTLFDSIEG